MGGGASSSVAIAAPGVATSTVPAAATPLPVVAPAPMVVPTVNPRVVAPAGTNTMDADVQPFTRVGASLAFPTAAATATVSTSADVFTPQVPSTSFATPMFTIPAMDGGTPTTDGTPPVTKTTTAPSAVAPSEPIDAATPDDAPKARDPKAPKDAKPSKVERVELTSDVTSPPVAGTTIRVTAKPSGGVAPYQYQWRVMDGGTWSLPTEWSETATFTWTPATATADLGIRVGVKSASSLDDTPDAQSTVRFVIKAVGSVATPAASTPPAARGWSDDEAREGEGREEGCEDEAVASRCISDRRRAPTAIFERR